MSDPSAPVGATFATPPEPRQELITPPYGPKPDVAGVAYDQMPTPVVETPEPYYEDADTTLRERMETPHV